MTRRQAINRKTKAKPGIAPKPPSPPRQVCVSVQLCLFLSLPLILLFHRFYSSLYSCQHRLNGGLRNDRSLILVVQMPFLTRDLLNGTI